MYAILPSSSFPFITGLSPSARPFQALELAKRITATPHLPLFLAGFSLPCCVRRPY